MLDETAAAPVTEEVETDPVASWLSRAGAFAVDVLFPLGVVATMALVALSASRGSWLWWLSVSAGGAVLLLVGINRLLLPVITGWSLGRALAGIGVVHRGQPGPERPGHEDRGVGPWRLLARDVAHLLDTASLFVGWLWPLWDSGNRTFADLLARTVVRRLDNRPANARRLTARVLVALALLSAVGAGLSYLAVYRHDQAVDRARDEIHGQGPKIVADMLSYGAGSLQADFARAQSLTTDGYRPQLIAQQEAVKKRGPTTNEYWAAGSSVLSASPDRASMLIMLQGERSASEQNQRFITATVRVNFEKSGAGHWRVADLTVLTKPRPNEAGK